MAVPPSLSVSVGVPPAHRHRFAHVERQRDGLAGIEVAASLQCRFQTQPTLIVGAVVSICGPLWVRPDSDRLAALPAPSVMVAAVEIDRGHREVGRVLSGRHRVAEGQRIGAGAAAIGRGAAVVEGQRRRAARHRHRLAQVERQRHVLPASRSPLAGRLRQPTITVGVVVSICSVPAGLVTAPARLAALPAPSVTVAAVEIDRRHREVGRVLPGRHRVAEGQRIGAGAAAIGRGAAVVERQRRRAARHRHRLAQVERQRHGLAGIKIAAPLVMPCRRTDDTVGVVVSICSVPAGLVTAPAQIGGIAGAVGDGRRVEIDRGHREVRRVLPGRHRVAEGQRIGAGAAAIGRGAAVVERQRRRAARHRHRLAQVERQRHGLAGIKVAAAAADAGSRRHQRRHRRRRGVDLRAALGQAGQRQVGGIAGAVGDRRAVEIDRRHRQVGRVLPGRRRCS